MMMVRERVIIKKSQKEKQGRADFIDKHRFL